MEPGGTTQLIAVEIKDGWRKLVLNRPEKLNAVNPAMLTELLQAIGEAEADGSHAWWRCC